MTALIFVTFINYFVPLFSAILLSRVILSYILKPSNPLLGFLIDLTEPILAPVRRLFPSSGGIDFAPLATLLLLQGLQIIASNLIHG